MAAIQVRNVTLEENPAKFTNDLDFNIRFDCMEQISDDLNWKVVYVGSSQDEKYDQTLEDVEVGPVTLGANEFVLNCPAPDPTQIPPEHLLGVTAILLAATYKEQEFIRVGWYVNNDYESQEERDQPPAKPQYDRIVRNVLVSQPKVTTRTIDWK
eukprot:TRINITY_DN75299_c0_g1_i1.p1 TRINITY_DN75299_c0_g1~~TRINITY_DN75299_c0_g1_i1.p1  ORF type:complete len:155 (+),score=24.02 TRINITY_DN75299_c0_g1_i1:55-519(+)